MKVLGNCRNCGKPAHYYALTPNGSRILGCEYHSKDDLGKGQSDPWPMIWKDDQRNEINAPNGKEYKRGEVWPYA
jgi:hypothetical protein